MSTPALTPLPGGPLRLRGPCTLTAFGEPQAVDGEVYLCRCGESANAPFCDGSHRGAGFTGEPGPAPQVEARVWTGQRVRTRFDPGVCMHVFTCKPLNALRAREADGDAEAADEIVRVVMACPSGALQVERLDGAPLPEAPAAAEVEVMPGGELRVRGPVALEGAALLPDQPADRLTLCRCGLSARKPFCDGRHKKRAGFR
jgi:CDGSH-type Zn-finger protein